jgi:hypothetical protein
MEENTFQPPPKAYEAHPSRHAQDRFSGVVLATGGCLAPRYGRLKSRR